MRYDLASEVFSQSLLSQLGKKHAAAVDEACLATRLGDEEHGLPFQGWHCIATHRAPPIVGRTPQRQSSVLTDPSAEWEKLWGGLLSVSGEGSASQNSRSVPSPKS